jgi:acetyl esterase
MTMDPQAAAVLERMAALGGPATEQMSPLELRALSEESADAQFGPSEDVLSVADVAVDGVPVRLYSPSADDEPATVVYAHGGGWVIGSLHTHDGLCRALANRSGCRIAAVDYRLAPEHRFPAAVEDMWTVTRWALDRSPRVAVAGDSAGGNLAAVAALRARDEGLRLVHQALVYPVLDHRFDTPSYGAYSAAYGLTRAGMAWYWEHYLGDADGAHPDASPLRAPSVAGVAPALVVVCGLDPLRDEGVAYAERLRAAGVATRLLEYEGMIHGFARMPASIDRARHALDEIGFALRDALTPG